MQEVGGIQIKKRINARKIMLSYLYQHRFFLNMQKSIEKPEIRPQESIEIQLQDWADTQISTAQQPAEISSGSGFLGEEFLAEIEKKKQTQNYIDEYVKAKIAEYAVDMDIESDFWYFLTHFFDMWSQDDVDVDYVLRVGAGIGHYEAELIEKVNRYAQTFKYEQMDGLDQACLLLGYLEFKLIGTPKELIINEMVELATRYSDEGSPRLVNGILHPLLTEEANTH